MGVFLVLAVACAWFSEGFVAADACMQLGILPQGFAGVQKILLIAFGTGKMTGASVEKFKAEPSGGVAYGGDGFLMQGSIGDDTAGTHVLARQFELRLDED